MRPLRFVALSEDGQALVLTDEVGRLLALPIDERLTGVMRADRAQGTLVALEPNIALSPRDIQARIRSGESAEEVARIAGVPVDRVLRYAGPVLQERAMLAQHGRRTRLRDHERNATLAEVVDARLAKHGVDAEKVSWDAYRRDDGTWRVVATWPSGKATAQAVWELDKARQLVTPFDEMAQYLCADRATAVLGQDPGADTRYGHDVARPEPTRGGHGLPGTDTTRPDPIRAGRDALLASLDRPPAPGRSLEPTAPAAPAASVRPVSAPAGSAFADDDDAAQEVPAVPSLAVLRPRRTAPAEPDGPTRPRKRLPSWDDVLFGSAPQKSS